MDIQKIKNKSHGRIRNNFEDLDNDEEVKKGEVEKIDIDQKEV